MLYLLRLIASPIEWLDGGLWGRACSNMEIFFELVFHLQVGSGNLQATWRNSPVDYELSPSLSYPIGRSLGKWEWLLCISSYYIDGLL